MPRGDLRVKIKVKKDRNWSREDNNLILKKQINVFDLMLGCVIIIRTLDDRNVKLTIPKGTSPGKIFSIPGYGVPHLHTKQKGNLYVKIDADVPLVEDENILKNIEQIRNQLYTKG